MRRVFGLGAVAAAVTTVLAGPVPAAAATTTTAASSSATPVYEVKTGVVHGLGRVLVDGQGFTLYVFAPDKHSGHSVCYGECATGWPPLLLPSGVSQVRAGPGVKAGLLGTTRRTGGTIQLTYKKWPLYLWVIDTAPGQATGQDLNNLGGKWYVITPAGLVLTKHLSSR